MQTAIRPITSLWTTVRTQVRGSRDAHATRVALQRDLATYHSQADLDDLHAILDRYTDTETKEIRRILAAQRSR